MFLVWFGLVCVAVQVLGEPNSICKRWRYGSSIPVSIANVCLPFINVIDFEFLIDQTTSIGAHFHKICPVCKFTADYVPQKLERIVIQDTGVHLIIKQYIPGSRTPIDVTEELLCKYDCFECIKEKLYDDL